MKLASRLVWLYPDAWRKRYGDEFVALVEDIGPSPGLVVDVAVAALRLRLAGLVLAARRPRLANGLNPGGEQMIAQSRHSQLFLAMAIVLAILGAAGFFLHSFAYPLALILAALFGVAGAASVAATKSSRQRGLLFGVVVALALVATYLFVVSGGGGPPSPSPSR